MHVGEPLTSPRRTQGSAFRRRSVTQDRAMPEGVFPRPAGSTRESVDPEFDAIELAEVLRSLAVAGAQDDEDEPC